MDWVNVSRLRYRKLVASRGRRLAAVLVVLGLLVTGAAVADAASPPTMEVTDREHVQTVETTANTQAVITEETDLYDRGAVLENQPLYLMEASPNLTVEVETSVPDGQSVELIQELTLVYRAKTDGETFWTRTRVLEQEHYTGTENGGVTATVDIVDVARQVERIQREVGSEATVSVVIRHEAEYDTGRYAGKLDTSAPIRASDRTYALGDGLADRKTHSEEVTYHRPVPAETYTTNALTREIIVPRRSVTFALAGLLLFAAGGHAAWLRRRGVDAETAERELRRQRFGEWISEGQLPNVIGNHHVPVNSLADLVDIAIDTNRRVVHDSNRQVYAVVDGNVVYYYGVVNDWIIDDNEFVFSNDEHDT